MIRYSASAAKHTWLATCIREAVLQKVRSADFMFVLPEISDAVWDTLFKQEDADRERLEVIGDCFLYACLVRTVYKLAPGGSAHLYGSLRSCLLSNEVFAHLMVKIGAYPAGDAYARSRIKPAGDAFEMVVGGFVVERGYAELYEWFELRFAPLILVAQGAFDRYFADKGALRKRLRGYDDEEEERRVKRLRLVGRDERTLAIKDLERWRKRELYTKRVQLQPTPPPAVATRKPVPDTPVSPTDLPLPPKIVETPRRFGMQTIVSSVEKFVSSVAAYASLAPAPSGPSAPLPASAAKPRPVAKQFLIPVPTPRRTAAPRASSVLRPPPSGFRPLGPSFRPIGRAAQGPVRMPLSVLASASASDASLATLSSASDGDSPSECESIMSISPPTSPHAFGGPALKPASGTFGLEHEFAQAIKPLRYGRR